MKPVAKKCVLGCWIAAILPLLGWCACAIIGNQLSMAPYERERFELRWMLVAVGASVLVGAAFVIYREALRRKRQRGLCGNCGYDLRASVGNRQCPECGFAISVAI